MFLGEYEHSLDAKGRMAIPARFRALLEGGAIITRGFDRCLVIYPPAVWSDFARRLDALPSTQAAAKRFIFAKATECEFDKQGRILVPAALRSYAELSETAVVVGQYSRIEIWDHKRWRDISAEAEDNSDKIVEQLASLGLDI